MGNTAEQIVGLAQHINKGGENPSTVVVEHPWQKTLVQLVPSLKSVQIEVTPHAGDLLTDDEVCVPDVYRKRNSYNAGWERLEKVKKGGTPLLARDSFSSEKSDLIMMFKSQRFTHPGEPKRMDAHRFVRERKYHKAALQLARQGLRIVRIGGPEQPRMPMHPNISDLAGVDKLLAGDLDALNSSRAALFTDSGLWPVSVGMGKPTLVADVVSDLGTYTRIPFVPFLYRRVGEHRTDVFGWAQGPYTTLIRKRRICLGTVCLFIPVSKKQLIAGVVDILMRGKE